MPVFIIHFRKFFQYFQWRWVYTSKSPLHLAIEQGDGSLVKDLIDHGADVNAKDDKGKTALGYAAASGSIQILYLLQIKQVDFSGDAGKDAVKIALLKRDANFLEELIKFGASPDVRGKGGNTPLHYAVESNNESLAKACMVCPQLINSRNAKLQTPAYLALKKLALNMGQLFGQHILEHTDNNEPNTIDFVVSGTKLSQFWSSPEGTQVAKSMYNKAASLGMFPGDVPKFFYDKNFKLSLELEKVKREELSSNNLSKPVEEISPSQSS